MKQVRGELIQHPRFICSHQLSWPRRTPTGEHYQICVQCGTRFGYDWETMRRLRKLPDTLETQLRSESPTNAHVRWVCRERRVRCQLPVLYRVGRTDQWHCGWTENISMSGLLLRAGIHGIPSGTLLELVIQEPRELTGRESLQVHCSAISVRTAATNDDRQNLVACARKDYRSTSGHKAA